MSDYTPDKWVMLKFTHKGQDVYKILASFYGGYLDGDSWKLNSGVTKVEEDDNYYYFHGYSGSVYACHKEAYGMSMYAMSIYNKFLKQVGESEDTKMELLYEDDTNFMEIKYD